MCTTNLTWADWSDAGPEPAGPEWAHSLAATAALAAWPADREARASAVRPRIARPRAVRPRAARLASPPAADSLAAWPELAAAGPPRPRTPPRPPPRTPTPPRTRTPTPPPPSPRTFASRRAGRVFTLVGPGSPPPPTRRRTPPAPPRAASPLAAPGAAPDAGEAAAREAFRAAPGRAVGLSSRARGAFAALSHESPDYLRGALAEIRGGNLVDIYQRNPCRWMHRGVGAARAHFVKIEEAKGATSIVVLVLFSKDAGASRALIVSAFRRTHKGGRQYLVTPADLQALDELDPTLDRYGELADMCW